jgi:hypothetical protein
MNNQTLLLLFFVQIEIGTCILSETFRADFPTNNIFTFIFIFITLFPFTEAFNDQADEHFPDFFDSTDK